MQLAQPTYSESVGLVAPPSLARTKSAHALSLDYERLLLELLATNPRQAPIRRQLMHLGMGLVRHCAKRPKISAFVVRCLLEQDSPQATQLSGEMLSFHQHVSALLGHARRRGELTSAADLQSMAQAFGQLVAAIILENEQSPVGLPVCRAHLSSRLDSLLGRSVPRGGLSGSKPVPFSVFDVLCGFML